jgi:hypothetical protein
MIAAASASGAQIMVETHKNKSKTKLPCEWFSHSHGTFFSFKW